ncbi:fimbria/pilus outer membrane usher protein [Escherichia coli]
MRNGINLGAWRFRNYSTLNSYDGNVDYHSGSVITFSATLWHYVARLSLAIPGRQAMPLISTQVRGVRLYTDDDMLPSSQNGFAPVVHGIAKTNATVIIKQNG